MVFGITIDGPVIMPDGLSDIKPQPYAPAKNGPFFAGIPKDLCILGSRFRKLIAEEIIEQFYEFPGTGVDVGINRPNIFRL